MNADDELEMLLGEIPHATSSLNLHTTPLSDSYHHHHRYQKSNNFMDHHGYGHASSSTSSCVSHTVNGHCHGQGYVDGSMYSDEMLRHNNKHAWPSSSSPLSGLSWPSHGSSTSLLSFNGRSLSDIGSPTPSHFEELKNYPLVHGNGLVDEFNLAGDFSRMYINDRKEGVSPLGNSVRSSFDQYSNRALHMNLDKDDFSDRYRSGFQDHGGIHVNVSKEPLTFDRSPSADWRMPSVHYSDRLNPPPEYANSVLHHQFYRTNALADSFLPTKYPVSDGFDRPMVGDGMLYDSPNGMMNLIETNKAYRLPHMVQLAMTRPYYNDEKSLNYQPPIANGRLGVSHIKIPQQNVETLTREDSLIIQGDMINYGTNRVQTQARSRGQNAKSLYHEIGSDKHQEKKPSGDGRINIASARENCRSPKTFSPYYSPKCSSHLEVRGSIYQMAKDQNGCRSLQREFDEGPEKVDIIFNEIIDHVVELMLNPFGNYLMQKLLDVCDEEQRLHILLRVTAEPGQLVTISLNTHGTRVVQKLIETLTSKKQIKLVVSALEPGFLHLIKDLNGNHVVQRCLQCFSTEDSKFIFVAAAKYCVDIARHQHGCCVLQRCINHSTGELMENLVAEISANGLHLAQDAFGNYVVQFVLDLKHPSATLKMTSQFSGNYVHLSMQKFSSHVVEKCLNVGDGEIKSKIIRELLSPNYFEQLLQDPHANYVIQTALRVSEGTLHNSLVEKIESYKENSRNSPYSKRIFSNKLLKR